MLRDRGARRFWAVVCLFLFLAVEVLASSSALHKAVHSDADSPLHHCAVTLLSHGNLTSATVGAESVMLAAALLLNLPPLKSTAAPSFDYRLPATRAPPQSSPIL